MWPGVPLSLAFWCEMCIMQHGGHVYSGVQRLSRNSCILPLLSTKALEASQACAKPWLQEPHFINAIPLSYFQYVIRIFTLQIFPLFKHRCTALRPGTYAKKVVVGIHSEPRNRTYQRAIPDNIHPAVFPAYPILSGSSLTFTSWLILFFWISKRDLFYTHFYPSFFFPLIALSIFLPARSWKSILNRIRQAISFCGADEMTDAKQSERQTDTQARSTLADYVSRDGKRLLMIHYTENRSCSLHSAHR